MTSNRDNGTNRNDDRRTRSEYDRRERAEDRKIGQVILGSLAVLVLGFVLIVMFSGRIFNVADRSEPLATGSTAPTATTTPTK